MAKLLIRFTGLCAFVSDKPDIAHATNVTVILVDAEKADSGTEYHFPALTFKGENYVSGASSGWAVQLPDDPPIGVWPLEGKQISIETPHKDPKKLKVKGSEILSKIDDWTNSTDDIVHEDCFKDVPTGKPVAARLSISAGIVSTNPQRTVIVKNDEKGTERTAEMQLSWETDIEQIELKIHPFGKPEDFESLRLKSVGEESIEIGIGVLSAESLRNDEYPDHDLAYLKLLKNEPKGPEGGPVAGGGLGCIPLKLTRET